MEFLYKVLSTTGYGVSMWLQVRAFRDFIHDMIANKEHISNTTVWPIMDEILKQNANHKEIDGVPIGVLKHSFKDVRRGSYAEMSESYIGRFAKIYNEVMALRKNEDFVVNPKQMDRFLDLVGFFIRKANEAGDGEVPDMSGFEPKEQHGSVTIKFVVFDLSGETEVQEFCKVLKSCSAVSIDATLDNMVCISCTVPNVFVSKTELE